MRLKSFQSSSNSIFSISFLHFILHVYLCCCHFSLLGISASENVNVHLTEKKILDKQKDVEAGGTDPETGKLYRIYLDLIEPGTFLKISSSLGLSICDDSIVRITRLPDPSSSYSVDVDEKNIVLPDIEEVLKFKRFFKGSLIVDEEYCQYPVSIVDVSHHMDLKYKTDITLSRFEEDKGRKNEVEVIVFRTTKLWIEVDLKNNNHHLAYYDHLYVEEDATRNITEKAKRSIKEQQGKAHSFGYERIQNKNGIKTLLEDKWKRGLFLTEEILSTFEPLKTSFKNLEYDHKQNDEQFYPYPQFKVHQYWSADPTDNEAIYGGGEFQNGYLDYKFMPIDWIQFNTEAIIPFLLSSKGYGILWDNYSRSKLNPISEVDKAKAMNTETKGKIMRTKNNGHDQMEKEIVANGVNSATTSTTKYDLSTSDSCLRNHFNGSKTFSFVPKFGGDCFFYINIRKGEIDGDYPPSDPKSLHLSLYESEDKPQKGANKAEENKNRREEESEKKIVIQDWKRLNNLPNSLSGRATNLEKSKSYTVYFSCDYPNASLYIREVLPPSYDMSSPSGAPFASTNFVIPRDHTFETKLPNTSVTKLTSTTSIQSEIADLIDYYFTWNPDTNNQNVHARQYHKQESDKASSDDTYLNTRYRFTMDGSIQSYRKITGQAKLYNKWVYGFWQCKEHYHNQTEILSAIETFREKAIPVDAVVQDWK